MKTMGTEQSKAAKSREDHEVVSSSVKKSPDPPKPTRKPSLTEKFRRSMRKKKSQQEPEFVYRASNAGLDGGVGHQRNPPIKTVILPVGGRPSTADTFTCDSRNSQSSSHTNSAAPFPQGSPSYPTALASLTRQMPANAMSGQDSPLLPLKGTFPGRGLEPDSRRGSAWTVGSGAYFTADEGSLQSVVTSAADSLSDVAICQSKIINNEGQI